MNKTSSLPKALLAMLLVPLLLIAIVGASLPEQGDLPFKRFGNSILVSYSFVTIILIANMVFYADSRHKPLSPVVSMIFSLALGTIITYLVLSSGDLLIEDNGSVRAQAVSNLVRLFVTGISVLAALSVVVGTGFFSMTNARNQESTKQA